MAASRQHAQIKIPARAAAPLVVQRKLAVGKVDDAAETEADRIAEHVMSSTALPPVVAAQPTVGQISRKCAECSKEEEDSSEETIRRKPAGAAVAMETVATSGVRAVLRSTGSPLEGPTRRFMEDRFGYDFSRVRIHADQRSTESARNLNAVAYTVGQDIVFQSSHYAPQTPTGRRLLAHELTHVVQQTRPRRVSPSAPQVKEGGTASVVRRSVEGAVLGGLAGAAGGALIGVLAGGPIGAAIGAVIGGALGAVAGHFLTRSKGSDKENALERISRLLTRGILHWAITDSDAREALEILRSLRPADLVETARLMKFSGLWTTLGEELPAADRLGFQYFDSVVLNPDRGYVMPGDRLRIELFTANSEPEKTETEFLVDRQGCVTLPYLPDPVKLGELLPKEAANAIVKQYVDAALYWRLEVHVTPLQRGSSYGAQASVSSPETAVASLDSGDANPKEGARRRKFKTFVDYIRTVRATDNFTAAALNYYYDQVDRNLDAYDTPEQLWDASLKNASRPVPVSPLRAYLDLARSMTAQMALVPPEEKTRLQSALNRYVAWVDAHSSDPNLTRTDPATIWSKSYLNAITEEVSALQEKALAAARDAQARKDWDRSVAKFDDALNLMRTKVWATAPPESVQAGEQLNEEGDRVKVSYLVQPSEAEKVIRNQIARSFMDDIVKRMTEPGFTNTTALDDFVSFLNKSPEKLKALQLTMSHPDVERFEDEVDIPGWQTAIEVVVSFIPFVGNAVAAGEVITGQDLFGHPLTTTERTILAVAVLLPFAAKVFKAGKAAVTVAQLAKDYRMTAAESRAAYRMLTHVAPGTAGAKLIGDASQAIKQGKAAQDAQTLKEVDQLLHEMGMTDKETAKVFARPGTVAGSVEQTVERAASEEIAALGPMSEDTQKLLKENGSLRKALVDNSLAATVLKKCASPCYPPGATAEQVERLERFLEKMKKTGPYDEEALRTYLYNHREDLDSALHDLIGGTDDSTYLNQKLAYFNKGRKIIRAISAEAVEAHKEAMHDLGVMYGRMQAGKDGLVTAHFENPIKGGKFGQGFDDVLVEGLNVDRDPIYIVEYKGGPDAKLATGQMELAWVVGNIQRLYREGGVEGQIWAQRLAKALSEGRLRGIAYHTKEEAAVASQTITDTIGHWSYKQMKVQLGP
jgi:Domain of unknown function (DUF4157)/Pre-toxin TG